MKSERKFQGIIKKNLCLFYFSTAFKKKVVQKCMWCHKTNTWIKRMIFFKGTFKVQHLTKFFFKLYRWWFHLYTLVAETHKMSLSNTTASIMKFSFCPLRFCKLNIRITYKKWNWHWICFAVYNLMKLTWRALHQKAMRAPNPCFKIIVTFNV